MTDKSKVLIVDDEPLNVKLIAAILASAHYEIIKAYCGKEALKKVDDLCPEIIILDIMMPDIDGFEVTRKLKANYKTKDIPIILITASDTADFKVIGQEAGADEFLNKPIKALELKSRVQSLIHTKIYLDKLTLKEQSSKNEIYHSEDKILQAGNDIKSVLLVSEDEKLGKLVQMYLNNQPYRVYTCKTFQKALERSQEGQLDLILFDLGKGDEQSISICHNMKENVQTTNIQTLVVSDSETLEKKHEQFEIWADDFLIMPINVHEIRLRVKALLKKKTYLDKLYDGTGDNVSAAIFDKLSGLANRSYFEYFLEQEIKRSLRDGSSIALLIIDLKDVINNADVSGPLSKGKLIKNVGAIIKEKIRDIDLGVRLNENQFAVVLVNTDNHGAKVVAERLESRIQKYLSLSIGCASAKKRMNFGIAVYPTDADSMDLLLRQVENKLLETKHGFKARIYGN